MSALVLQLRMRREHRWSRGRISDYVDGELRTVERQRLERHAALCAECGPLLRSLLRLVVGLRSLGDEPEETVVPGVLRRLRAGG